METNDIVTKNFESYADVAADIINVLLNVMKCCRRLLRVFTWIKKMDCEINWKM